MDPGNTFTLIREFTSVFSKFLWPIAIVAGLFIATRVVPPALKRLNNRNTRKQRAKFSLDIAAFEQAVKGAREQLGLPFEGETHTGRSHRDKEQEEILKTASVDPEMAVIMLSGALDKQARILRGLSGGSKGKPVFQGVGPLKHMLEKRHLPKGVVESLETYERLGNKIVREGIKKEVSEVKGLMENGLSLLKMMKSIPGMSYRVHIPDIDLYSNEDCTELIRNAKGIVLERVGPEKKRIDVRILPTSRMGYYEKGRTVTWEWNVEKLWGTVFYVNPETREKEKAWGSSAEFCGRHVDEL